MSEFLTTVHTMASIERIMETAREKLLIVSAYQRIGPRFEVRIREAAQRGVAVTLVHGDQSDDVDRIISLAALQNVRVHHCPKLHAKCYANEHEAIVGSFNLTESSERNWEMGVRLSADEPAYAEALLEIERVLQVSQREWPRVRERAPWDFLQPANRSSGHCIRCGTRIALNTSRPLCSDCFAVWREWSNPEYEEQCCHGCGRPEATTFARPLCEGCFRAA